MSNEISNERLERYIGGEHIAYPDAMAMAKELLALRNAREGWKLVPVEPTQAMIDAYNEGMISGGASKAYREMLAAAPEVGSSLRCAAARDGECNHAQCPQLRDGEPENSGRHCPIDNWDEED